MALPVDPGVLVTGASSFLGAHLVKRLRHDRPASRVVSLVHRTTLGFDAGEVVSVDLTAPDAVERLVALRPRVLVHLACRVSDAQAPAVNKAMLDTLLEVCRRTGAGLVHTSTTQVHWERKNAYARSRIEEEEAVATSGIPHAILRPCAPYGPRHRDHSPRHRESFHLLADLVRKLPALPIIGAGRQLRQPVHVDDWNDVILRLVDRDPADLPGEAYDVGGPVPYTFLQLVDRMALELGKRVVPLTVPVPLCRLAARFVDGLSADLVETFPCDDTADPAPIAAEVGKSGWIRFETGVRDLVGDPWETWHSSRAH